MKAKPVVPRVHAKQDAEEALACHMAEDDQAAALDVIGASKTPPASTDQPR